MATPVGIAQMMRVGLFKPVHVKTPASQHRRLLLTSRKLLQRKTYDLENDLRGSLRNFGLKVGMAGAAKFEGRIRELVAGHPIIAAIVGPLLEARAALRAQFDKLHRMLLELARADPVCRRLMTAPGVGPVVALTFRTCVDNPARFSRSRCVGAHYGLTPRLHQSGETARVGRISRWGDTMMRVEPLRGRAGPADRLGPLEPAEGLGRRGRQAARGPPRRSWRWPASSPSRSTACGATGAISAGRRRPDRPRRTSSGSSTTEEASPRGRRDRARPWKLVRRSRRPRGSDGSARPL